MQETHSVKSPSPIKVGLVQIGDKFGDQYYLPYAMGLLQAYAIKHLVAPEQYDFSLPIYSRLHPDEALNRLHGSQIVFFSAYIWNYNLSLRIAQSFKESYPESLIVFGGPQVPEAHASLYSLLATAPFIDIGCYGEGEKAFLGILENVVTRKWSKVPSIAYRCEDEVLINPPGERIEDLDEILSPYLGGVFDPLIAMFPSGYWSALMETNRGCPFTCAFCYWGSKSRKALYSYSTERVFQEIDWFSKNGIEFLFCCDANFGIFDRDLEIARKVAENKNLYSFPRVFSIQSTKNSSEKIYLLQKTLSDAGLQKGVNLALQSLNPETLASIMRSNISSESYKELAKMFGKSGIPTFSDLILGLPGETYNTFTDGVSDLIECGQHNRIQFINLTLLGNTAMADEAYVKSHGLLVTESRIISHHTSLTQGGEILESQRLVVGTGTMPPEDWVKGRIFCWMVSLLYFDKLLQIPFILLNRLNGINCRKLTEALMAAPSAYRVFNEIIGLMTQKAQEIQQGGPEYYPSERYLNVWWPLDEFIYIDLATSGKLENFYRESESLLQAFAAAERLKIPHRLLHQAIELNMSLLKQPFIRNDVEITLEYDIPEFYNRAIKGEDAFLEPGCFTYVLTRSALHWESWEDWTREVVWYGSKKGDYLYSCYQTVNDLACRNKLLSSNILI